MKKTAKINGMYPPLERLSGQKAAVVLFMRNGDLCIKLNGVYLPTKYIRYTQNAGYFAEVAIVILPTSLDVEVDI